MRCDFMSEVSGCAAGIACSMMIAQVVYDVPAVVILNSCVRAITAWDLITSMIKAWVFGAIISIVSPSCNLPHLQRCRSCVSVWSCLSFMLSAF